MGKRKRLFQIEDIDCVYPYLPQILKTRLGDKQFLNRRYCLTPMGKRKRPFQIEDIDYIYPYLLQILKTRLGDKHFLNRRYCLTTNGEAETTVSNRRY